MICTERMIPGFVCMAMAAAAAAQQGSEPESGSWPDRTGAHETANDTAGQPALGRAPTFARPQSGAGPAEADDLGQSNAESRIPSGQAFGMRSRSRLVEEIVVTAQKREESVQDVPISINAFSADLLDARGISDPTDLPRVTPGLAVGALAGFTITYLRGVGSDAFLMADPSVAMMMPLFYWPATFLLDPGFRSPLWIALGLAAVAAGAMNLTYIVHLNRRSSSEARARAMSPNPTAAAAAGKS